jgi:hypothetical protein
MGVELTCFDVRRPVAMAWYYAIANWKGRTRVPLLDASNGRVKVCVEASDAAFEDLRNTLIGATTSAPSPVVASSAASLLAEIDQQDPLASLG